MTDSCPPNLVHTLLHQPDKLPFPADAAKLIETHISWILLAGDYAYKFKKPLNLGFLDFSTLAQRHYFCQQELQLNQRLAPAYYLDVLPVYGDAQHPTFQSNDTPPVEYAVLMRRFDNTRQLDRLAQQHQIDPDIISQLAQQIARFHQHAPTLSPDIIDIQKQIIDPALDNFTVFFSDQRNPPDQQLELLYQQIRRLTRQLWPLWQQRARQQHVKDCHGDLHLGNITLDHGTPVIFDCIEFEPSFRQTDTLNDLAFTLMDLLHFDCRLQAWQLLNEYLQHSGDYQALPLLPFYLSYRAMIRAKIAYIEQQQASTPRSAEKVHSYLQLAQQCLQPNKTPALLITCGVSGSGKSWLGHYLQQHFQLIQIRSDIERQRLTLQAAQRYQPAQTERVYHILLEGARAALQAGYHTLIDATCLHTRQRALFRQLARDTGSRFYILYCQADRSVLQQRIQQRRHQPDNVSEATIDVMQQQLQQQQPPDQEEQPDTWPIDTSDTAALQQLVKRLQADL